MCSMEFVLCALWKCDGVPYLQLSAADWQLREIVLSTALQGPGQDSTGIHGEGEGGGGQSLVLTWWVGADGAVSCLVLSLGD